MTSSMVVGEMFGPGMAGLMSTFPVMSMTVLVMTHLESGPSSALQMARALPAGNLGMVAFLAAFRFGCPLLGLFWGTVAGYALALAILALIIWFENVRAILYEWFASILLLVAIEKGFEQSASSRRIWPRAGRRFSPWVEPLAA